MFTCCTHKSRAGIVCLHIHAVYKKTLADEYVYTYMLHTWIWRWNSMFTLSRWLSYNEALLLVFSIGSLINFYHCFLSISLHKSLSPYSQPSSPLYSLKRSLPHGISKFFFCFCHFWVAIFVLFASPFFSCFYQQFFLNRLLNFHSFFSPLSLLTVFVFLFSILKRPTTYFLCIQHSFKVFLAHCFA